MIKKERYWDISPKKERWSFPKRWKFQMDLLAGRSVLSVIAICMVMMMSSCSKNGVYFYFDDVVKHAYSDNMVQIFLYPYKQNYVAIYVHNNTDELIFVDKGTSFLSTSGEVEFLYNSSSDIKGDSKTVGQGVSWGNSAIFSQVGSFQGQMITEKRIVPIAPHSYTPIYIQDFHATLASKGYFGKSTSHRWTYTEAPKQKIKKGMVQLYDENNTILNYKACVRYSTTEDMKNYKEATTDNYLKAWVVDDQEGFYDYNNATLPYADKFRMDSDRYYLFGKILYK